MGTRELALLERHVREQTALAAEVPPARRPAHLRELADVLELLVDELGQAGRLESALRLCGRPRELRAAADRLEATPGPSRSGTNRHGGPS